jgi:PEP-CTERM/exosortase A-associated glycosyltransferase
MRVLHILDHSLPLQSGYTFRTVAILREQRALGWETLQLTTPRHGEAAADAQEVDGWRFHRTSLPAGPLSFMPGVVYVREMAATARRIGELIDEHSPDILHAHSPVLNVLPALWVGRKRSIPVVYEVRALWEDAAVDHGTTVEGGPRYRLSRALETYALRRADRITTICEGLRGEIVARGIPADKITVIPNAVDTREFRFGAQPDPTLRQELGLADRIVLGFAGSFYGYEGLDLLIEAATMLLPRGVDIAVLLVGGGPQEAALRALAARCGLAERVVFTGRVPHNEIQRYYDLIDILAYPRRRMRLTDIVTPLKPLEAMAQGRMFVASDVGGHRELVRHDETGFLFPAGDAAALADTIERVLGRRSDWPRVRQQARKFVESERTWARSVARYADVYRGLVALRPTAVRFRQRGT